MSEQYESLHRMHILLGGTPHELHERLYKAFPSVLGYSGRIPMLFEAVLILALHQAGKDGAQNLQKVYFLVPGELEKHALTMIRSAAERIFGRLKVGTSVAAIKHFGELFHQLMLGSLVWSLHDEPARWVAFGFSKTDHIPEWMRAKLLEISEASEAPRPGV